MAVGENVDKKRSGPVKNVARGPFWIGSPTETWTKGNAAPNTGQWYDASNPNTILYPSFDTMKAVTVLGCSKRSEQLDIGKKHREILRLISREVKVDQCRWKLEDHTNLYNSMA